MMPEKFEEHSSTPFLLPNQTPLISTTTTLIKVPAHALDTHLLVREMQEEAMEPVRDAGAMAVLLADSRSLSRWL